MDYNSGELICKNCGNHGMNIYTNWLNRKKYINNSNETQWIFYNKRITTKKKFRFNYCFCFDGMSSKTAIICCPLLLVSFLIVLIFYLLIFIWIDIYKYCSQKTEYEFCYSYIENHNICKGNITSDDKKNIWNHCEGITESELNEEGAYFLFTCLKCNYHWDSFKDFIPNLSGQIVITPVGGPVLIADNNENDNTRTNLNSTPGLNIINDTSIMFFSCDQTVHFSVACKMTDTFDGIEEKLLQENPDLKNKKFVYLFHGEAINDKQKTLAELKMKNSDIVIFQEI